MTSFANKKKESKPKAINRYISLSDWKGISLQFNKKKVWFSFQKPGSNSNKSLCRDKSIIQQINILIENMSYAPDKLDINKIKESMSERQWNYLKPGVIASFVKDYNDKIMERMPSSAPMDKQRPSNYPNHSVNNDQYSESEYDDDINYTRPPSEYAQSHFDNNYSIKSEQHYNETDFPSLHEQQQDGLPSYPMEQHNYDLPSEVATFDDENQFNLSPAPIQDPSNAMTMNMEQDDDNDIDLLPTTLPTTLPTDHMDDQAFSYPDHGVNPYSYPPPKVSEYDYMVPPSSHYYDPLKMAMDSSHSVKYPMYPMQTMQSYPASMYAAYWSQMYNNNPTDPYMITPPSPKNIYVSKEDEKEYKEWLKEKNEAYDNYKVQMNKMKKYFEKRMEKAIENEGFWKKKYEDLLAKYTMQQSEIESMNESNNKSPATSSSSSQFSAAAVAMSDLNISDNSNVLLPTKPGKLRRNKRRLDETEDNCDIKMKQQSPSKRFKMDQDYIGNNANSTCCYSSDNISSTDDIMINNTNNFEDGFNHKPNNQFIF